MARRQAAEAYKTEASMKTESYLPVEWTVRSLRSCLRTAPAYGINAAAVPFDDGLPTYLRITDISDDHHFRPLPRVSIDHPNAPVFFLNEGDLVFARTGASVGKSYLYNHDDGPLVFAGFLIRVSPNPKDVQPAFLAYCVQSERYWDWVAATSSRSGQPGINGQEYGTFQLFLPPLDEQRAIAEALSDMDSLIQSLEALIAKKQAIKQATMQQLLTGKTRLPGFSGEWNTRQFGELFNRLNVKAHQIKKSEYGTYGLHPVIDQGQSTIISFSDQSDKLFRSPTGGVIVFGDHTRIVKFVDMDFLVGADGTQVLVIPGENITEFFFYQLFLKEIPDTGYNRHFRFLVDFTFEVPTPVEQTAIAAILSDMDAEIDALKRNRDKGRITKQGMMQQLLTGRIRLGKPAESWGG